MLKAPLLAAAIAVTAMFGTAAPATADVDVKIFLGFPHYGYRIGPGYIFRPGYGWYYPAPIKLSCKQGERLLERRGFDVRERLDCSGNTYQYRVINPNGKKRLVNLNARTGASYRAD